MYLIQKTMLSSKKYLNREPYSPGRSKSHGPEIIRDGEVEAGARLD
jgi:hypothetical protein